MATTVRQPVLVTGASGFIGGRLVRRLAEGDRRVSCLVRPGSCTHELLSAGVELFTGDVTERTSVDRALVASRAATVFHLAGLVRARHRRDFADVNTGGVEVVAAACATLASPPVLIVVSSLAAAGPNASEQPRVEGDIPTPVSYYGRSKLAGEQAAARFAGAVPISIVRPPIVFGPGDRAMLEVFRPIARWGLHFVPGRGTRRYSLVHVDDLVEGMLLVADGGERLPRRESPPGQGIYYFSEGDCPSFAHLGHSIATALGRRPPAVIRVPGPMMRLLGVGDDLAAWIRGRTGWIGRDKVIEALAGSWMCSAGKARARLGWSTGTNLNDRLRETAQWYREAGWL